MVFDSLLNFSNYISLHPQFADVGDFIAKWNITVLPEGRYEVNNRGTFANVNEYSSKDVSEGFIEFHRKYIDIQIVLQGVERVGLCHREDARELVFNEEKDFGELDGETDFLTLKEGYFIILFPHDGHMPQIMQGDNPEPVKKMVIKVPV